MATLTWGIFIISLSSQSSPFCLDQLSFVKKYLGDLLQYPGHFFLYLVFFILCQGVFVYRNNYRVKDKRALILTLIVTCLFALFDELYQIHVPNRAFQLRDLLVDSLAAIVGFVYCLNWQETSRE